MCTTPKTMIHSRDSSLLSRQANVIFLLVKALALQATQSLLVRMGQGSVHPGSARRTRCPSNLPNFTSICISGALDQWNLGSLHWIWVFCLLRTRREGVGKAWWGVSTCSRILPSYQWHFSKNPAFKDVFLAGSAVVGMVGGDKEARGSVSN